MDWPFTVNDWHIMIGNQSFCTNYSEKYTKALCKNSPMLHDDTMTMQTSITGRLSKI